jgi:general secretion pathway protein K
VMVILGLGLLAVIATAFTASMRSHVQGAANTVSNAKAEALADAGVQLAISKLVTLRRSPPAAGSAWPVAALVDCAMPNVGTIHVAVEDEAGKIDVNFSDDRLLGGVLRGLGASPDEASKYVDRIVDFRDTDNLRRPHGAELPEYRAASLGYGPKNTLFETFEELEQVLGLPEALRRRLQPLITVHSRREGIDPSRAPQLLLDALADRVDASPSPTFASGPATAQPTAPRRSPVPQEFVTPSSFRAFKLVSEGVTPQQSRFVREAIVEFDNENVIKYAVRSWQRGDTTLSRQGEARLERSATTVPPCGN